jgi:hypothetical protein
MKPLYSKQDLEEATSTQPLPCECYICGKVFTKPKNEILDFLSVGRKRRAIAYCSRKCAGAGKITMINILCTNCKKPIKKHPCDIQKSKRGNMFCTQSCAAIWNNAHKTSGTKVSKLEVWLHDKLPELYPQLEFHFNRKDAINGELDIYVPSLKLAFELNGIFHYEPIYGANQLARIQSNDCRKFQACIERGIEFCTIDISTIKNFKPHKAEKCLAIISSVININLSKNNCITEVNLEH